MAMEGSLWPFPARMIWFALSAAQRNYVEDSALKLDIIQGSSEIFPTSLFKYGHKGRKTVSEKFHCHHL